MRLPLRVTLASLFFIMPAIAGPCPDTPPAPKPKHKHIKKTHPAPTQCERPDNGLDGKNGKDGRDGKNGKDGRDGKNARTIVVLDETPRLAMRIGVMGALYSEDWAWGPAIQLAQPLSRGFNPAELSLSAGLALPFDGYSWSPGEERGYMLRAGYAKPVDDGLALSVGADYTSIGDIVNYLGADAGVVLNFGHVKFQWGFTAAYDHGGDDVRAGLLGSLFGGF